MSRQGWRYRWRRPGMMGCQRRHDRTRSSAVSPESRTPSTPIARADIERQGSAAERSVRFDAHSPGAGRRRVRAPRYDELPDGVVIADAPRSDRRLQPRRRPRITGIDATIALGCQLAEALPLEDLEGRSWWALHRPVRRPGHPHRAARDPGCCCPAAATCSSPRGSCVKGTPSQRVIVGLRDTSARARAERRHADLIATVAHELRSPLTSVKGFTATLLAKWERFTDDQRKLMLETVDADADRVTRLIAELLDIARIDSGRLQLLRTPSTVEELIREQIAGMVAAGQDEERFVVTANPAAGRVRPTRTSYVRSSPTCSRTRCGTATAASPSLSKKSDRLRARTTPRHGRDLP